MVHRKCALKVRLCRKHPTERAMTSLHVEGKGFPSIAHLVHPKPPGGGHLDCAHFISRGLRLERLVSEQHYSWEPESGNGSDDCRWKNGSAECGRFIAWNITHPQQGIFIPWTPTLAWTPLTGTGPSGKSQLSKPTYCVMPLL